MSKRFYYFILLIIICFYLSGFSDISEGNRLFLSSDYKGAVEKYKEVSGKGVEDPDLYYNLATAYLYSGEYGKAIFWYYRAMMLKGSSEDIDKNIKLAFKELEEQGSIVRTNESFLYEFVIRYYNPIFSVIFVVLLNLLFLILILRKFSLIKRDMRFFIIVFSLIIVMLAALISMRIYMLNIQTRGIVLTKSVDIKEGPSDAYKTISQINEGTMVKINEKYQEFMLIEIPGGKTKGWILARDVGLLKAGKL